MVKPEIVIKKSVMPELPDTFRKTILGYPKGSTRQYRDDTGVHVREYEDRFVIHVDRIDPRKNPLGHLVSDSPETIALLSIAASRNRSTWIAWLFLLIPLTSFVLRFFKRLIF